STRDIYTAHRTDPALPFDPPAVITAVSSAEYDEDPYVTPDGLEMWFGRSTIQAASDGIYRTTRASPSAQWGAPVKVTNLPADAWSASLSYDQLTLFYVSGSTWKINRTTRASTADAFVAGTPIGITKTNAEDEAPSLAADGTLYLTTTAFYTNFGLAMAA